MVTNIHRKIGNYLESKYLDLIIDWSNSCAQEDCIVLFPLYSSLLFHTFLLVLFSIIIFIAFYTQNFSISYFNSFIFTLQNYIQALFIFLFFIPFRFLCTTRSTSSQNHSYLLLVYSLSTTPHFTLPYNPFSRLYFTRDPLFIISLRRFAAFTAFLRSPERRTLFLASSSLPYSTEPLYYSYFYAPFLFSFWKMFCNLAFYKAVPGLRGYK